MSSAGAVRADATSARSRGVQLCHTRRAHARCSALMASRGGSLQRAHRASDSPQRTRRICLEVTTLESRQSGQVTVARVSCCFVRRAVFVVVNPYRRR